MTVSLSISTPLLGLDGVQPMLVGDLRDMRLAPREAAQGLLELEQRTDVIHLVKHACRLFADLFIVQSKTHIDGEGGGGGGGERERKVCYICKFLDAPHQPESGRRSKK